MEMSLSYTDIFDTDNNGSRGVSEDTINKLPIHMPYNQEEGIHIGDNAT